MPAAVLQDILENIRITNVSASDHIHVYTGIEISPAIRCFKKVKMDMYLKIRRRFLWHLRNIVWKIPEKPFSCMVLGRPVFQYIDYDNKNMQEVACKGHDGIIDVKKALDDFEREEERMIASLFGHLTFRNAASAEDNGISHDFECAEFGADTAKEMDK